MLVEQGVDLLVEEGADRVGQVLVVEDLVALGVDRLALLVDHVVELDDALADVEVEALDAGLGALDRLAHEARLDRHVVLEAEALHQAGHAVRGEPLHQVVLEGQVEARRAGVALAAGAAAELVVDPPALVALGADDVEAARGHHHLVLGVAARLGLAEDLVVRGLVDLGRVEAPLVEQVGGEARRVAAEEDVGAAAGHVRGDRHRPAAPGLGDDPGLLLVELGVQDLVLHAAPAEHLAEDLRLLHRDRADEDGPARGGHLLDLVDQGRELAVLVAEDEVGVVLADHRLVGRDRHDLELVDLVELLALGHRRAGHAGELVVEAEVVLERDRGERHRLALDAQALLRLDRLVEPLAPAATRHLAPGELVDDDDLAVLDQVVLVAPVEGVRAQRLLEVAGEAGVGVVQVGDAEELLHLVDAVLGRRDGLVLEVDEVVAALLVAFGASLQPRHEPGERVVEVCRLLGLAADDQRRPRLVDEDVVDLVDDREVPTALDPLVELGDHVVAEVVEAELVVRAVGDVGGVGLAARDRPQVDETLVGRRVAGLEDVRRVVDDDPDREAQEVEDGAHPLRVAPGEVVVDGDDVDAPPGEPLRAAARSAGSCPRPSASRRSCPGGARRRPSAGRRSGASRGSAASPRGRRRTPRAGRRPWPPGAARSPACGAPSPCPGGAPDHPARARPASGRSRPAPRRARRGSHRRARGSPRRTPARSRARARWRHRRAAGVA